MKLVIILLTAAFLNVGATGISQTVTLRANQSSLEKIFAEVKQQTGLLFFYDVDLLKNTKPVSIDAKNMPVKEFLAMVVKGQGLEFLIENKAVVISGERTVVVNLKSTADVFAPPGSVIGRVTNEDGEALAGATVMVKGAINQGASTDINGYYKVENIPAGQYKLVVSFVGYATKMTVVKVNENGVANLDFTLVTSLVNLDQLTVTSTLSTRKIRAYPATIATIKQEDLKNRNLNNIANVLETVPGIIVTPGSEFNNNLNNIRQPDNLLIRGANAGVPIKYLVDGIEIVSAGGLVSFLQTLDPNDIENIEILKGPMASTLYGNGAAGGVIAITTKKGKQGKTKTNFKTMFTQYANDYADYSGYNQNYSVNVSGGSEQFNYLLGVGYNLYPITKLSDTSNGIDDKTWSYTAKIGGKVKKIAADLNLQYGKEKRGVGSTALSYNKYLASLGILPAPISPLDIRYFDRNFLTSIHLTHTITNNWYHDLTVGYNMTNTLSSYYIKNYAETYDNFESLYSKMTARYFMYYEHSWSAAIKSNITAGFEHNEYETRSTSLPTTTPLTDFFTSSTDATAGSASITKSPYSSTGYFAEVVTGFKNNLFLTTGMRYDVNPAYGDNIGGYPQPRVGLSYVIEADKFKIKPRIVWGVSSNAPDPTYKVTTISQTSLFTYVTVGNPDIKPQRSQGYEFGADIFYNNNFSLNITYYDQKIKDMIQTSFSGDFTTSPWTIRTYYYNIGEAVNRGLEVSAKAVIEPFILNISYTQTTSKWGDVTGQNPSATVYPHAPSLFIPKKSAFARLSYKIPSFLAWTKRGGSISLDWRYNGSAYNYDAIRYQLATNAWEQLPTPRPPSPLNTDYLLWQKGYSVFNLRADYSVANCAALYVDIQNLLDKQGSVNGQLVTQFPGRRINFGFNINF